MSIRMQLAWLFILMSVHNRLRLDIKRERIAIKAEEEDVHERNAA